MSADNFVGVRPNKDKTYSVFEYGNMSMFEEDCQYLKDAETKYIYLSREVALVAAHDLVNKMDICEYGVVEMSLPPDVPCGRCYVCVHVREIVSNDLKKCDHCGEAISDGEWTSSSQAGTFHHRCEMYRTIEQRQI